MALTTNQQEKYDEATFDFSQGRYEDAVSKFREILAEDPEHFEAQLALGMAYCRKEDYASAIAEGHKAEKLRPDEQLVHTNLSLFYMKAGNKAVAEHHGVRARIVSWKTGAGTASVASENPELALARPKSPPAAPLEKYPDMPWKKKPKLGGGDMPGVS